jgi:hypothetical protein
MKEMKKEMQIPAKGHNEILEVANHVEYTTVTNVDIGIHVPENGNT